LATLVGDYHGLKGVAVGRIVGMDGIRSGEEKREALGVITSASSTAST
jgi:hypothetical protein